MRNDNPWKVISSEIKYQNPWMRIREDKVITPTGGEGIYGVMESKDSVMIAALNDIDELCLIRVFAYPSQSWNWELPGGGGEGEKAELASQRELEEETGLRASTWIHLGKTRVSNGFMTEQHVTYLAKDLSHAGQKEFSDEQIDQVAFFSMAKIDEMIEDGTINDGESITGIHLAQKWLMRQATSVLDECQ